MTIVGIASMVQRAHLLEQTVASLRPQVDVVRIYLNDYQQVPSFLNRDEGLLAKDAAGDIGASGKFFWFDKLDHDYYFTADDDLLYAPNYVEKMIHEFDARRQKAVIGVHGFVFSEPIESYITSRKEKYKSISAQSAPHPVHVIGTGTALLNQNTIKLSLDDFPHKHMADLQLAIIAQKQRVPMVVIPREENWVSELQPAIPEHGFSIWKATKAEGGYAKAKFANQSIKKWQLFPDPA